MFSGKDLKKYLIPIYASKIICVDDKTRVVHSDTDEILAYGVIRCSFNSYWVILETEYD